jgi:hypothetical protein
MVPKPEHRKLFLSTLFPKYGILVGLIHTETLHFVQSDKRGHSEEQSDEESLLTSLRHHIYENRYLAFGRLHSFLFAPHPNLPPQGGKGLFGQTFSRKGGREQY